MHALKNALLFPPVLALTNSIVHKTLYIDAYTVHMGAYYFNEKLVKLPGQLDIDQDRSRTLNGNIALHNECSFL